MANVPGKGRVSRALKMAEREVKTAHGRVNQKAAKLLARGDYEGSQAFVDLGRAVQEFRIQLDEIIRKWRSLRTAGSIERDEKLAPTPAWKLYGPILRTLIGADGTMTWRAVEDSLRSGSDFQPLPGDLVTRRGKPYWVGSARKARGGLIKEGFIEKRGTFEWKITTAGRKAAESTTQS